MSKEIHVGIVGLGRVGSTFLEKLLASESKGIVIVGVVESNPDSPGAKLAQDKGITVLENSDKLVAMGDKIDVIFELTGNVEAKKGLRGAMVKTSNSHTVIAPEIMAFLIWDLISEGGELAVPGCHWQSSGSADHANGASGCLCPGWQGRVSLLGADEYAAGARCRRCRDSHDGACSGWRTQSAGIGRGSHSRR